MPCNHTPVHSFQNHSLACIHQILFPLILFDHHGRLDRTSDFLIYGHGQQKKAVVEAIRLYESEGGIKKLDAHEMTKSSDDVKIQNFKERSQKWQKFVTQVSVRLVISYFKNFVFGIRISHGFLKELQKIYCIFLIGTLIPSLCTCPLKRFAFIFSSRVLQ